jgi:GPH family glycoside/pentoside/hexuronide:cation symporter
MAQNAAQGIVTERIKLKEKLAYSLGDVASNVVWGGVSSFVTYYYTNSAGMAAAAIGTMFLVSRIFDGVSDITMGLIIDRTRSRFGKARPWLLWMLLPFAIATVLIFSVPQSWGPGAKLLYVYITYNLLSTVVYTAINLPYGTMTALITDDTRDRTLLNVFRMVGAVVCTIAVNSAVMPMVNGFGGGNDAWQKTFGIFGSIAAVLFLLCFLGTRERVGASTKKEDVPPVKVAIAALFKNKYWYLITGNLIIMAIAISNQGVNIYFAKYWMNNEGLVGLFSMATMGPAFLGILIATPISAKIGGRRNLCLAGNIVAITGIIIQALNPTNFVMLLTGFILRGFGLSAMMAVSFVMIADVIDYGEWKTGVRAEGLVYSASSFGQKVGTGVGAAILGWTLAFGGFNAAAEVQEKPAMTAILFVLIYLPLILYGISTLLYVLYKLDKELPGIRADLNQRHKNAALKNADTTK